jgi:hypothetical protein
MKKMVIMAVVLILNFGIKINASEMQIFGGLEAGFGVYKVKNDFAVKDTFFSYYHLFTENTSMVFFAPGFTFGMRMFPDNSPIGFVFRDRAIFLTNSKTTGKISIDSTYESVSETYSVASDYDHFIGFMDFDPGVSVRYIISDRVQLYSDLGLNLAVLQSETDGSSDALRYWGLGIFSTLAVQANISRTMYLEFGLNGIINILSNQEGVIEHPDRPDQVIKYEDTGRFDLISSAVYLTIGWRLDVEKLRARTWQTGSE